MTRPIETPGFSFRRVQIGTVLPTDEQATRVRLESMFLSRRRFMLSTAGVVLGAARTRAAWPLQTLLAAGPRRSGPSWQPNVALLRNLPRLLELSSVPGLALGVVEGGRIWSRGFGMAVEDPAEQATSETVF